VNCWQRRWNQTLAFQLKNYVFDWAELLPHLNNILLLNRPAGLPVDIPSLFLSKLLLKYLNFMLPNFTIVNNAYIGNMCHCH
jgi:hypothetical protein